MKKGADYKTIADIPAAYALQQDSQDVYATLEHIGRLDLYRKVGCLFALAQDGEIVSVYGSERYVPRLENMVFRIK